MTTLELLNANLKPLIVTSKIVGAEIWTSTKRYTPASYSIMIQIVIYFGCNFWTAYKFRDDAIQIMKILNCSGIALQLSVKFFMALSLKDRLKAVTDKIKINLYVRYSLECAKEYNVVLRYAQQLNIIWKGIAFLYCSTLFVFALYPLFIYITESNLIPLFMFEVPGVDWHTLQGYVVTNAVQVCTYVVGLSGMVLADFIFVYFVKHGIAAIDIFNIHMDQLAEMLKKKTPESNDEIDQLWKECLKDHVFITEFFNEIEDIFSSICLIQVFTGVAAICDNLVLMVLTDWYAAYLFLLVCFVQLSIYFIIGNAAELKVDTLNLYLSCFPWNLLSVIQQKEYSYMMCRMRKPFIITINGFAPLNFESYMTILKLLYRFFMLILNFIQ